jgi:hypothetical protein
VCAPPPYFSEPHWEQKALVLAIKEVKIEEANDSCEVTRKRVSDPYLGSTHPSLSLFLPGNEASTW